MQIALEGNMMQDKVIIHARSQGAVRGDAEDLLTDSESQRVEPRDTEAIWR